MSAAMTAALTVLAGFAVFVGGQIVQRFFLEPIQEQRKVIGEIAYVLLYHDNVGRFMSGEAREEVAATLRRLGGELRATRRTIPAYRQLASMGWVLKTDNLMRASAHLAGWSNAIIGASEDTTTQHKDIISESLSI